MSIKYKKVDSMPKVIGYTRISTVEQKQGNSLDYQEEFISTYCSLNNLELVAIHSDVASGNSLKREGLEELIKDLGVIDAIVVYHTDRLSRKLVNLLELIDVLNRQNVSLISTSQPEFDLKNPTGKMMLSILGAVAEFEGTRIMERMVNGRLTVKKRSEEFGLNLNYGKRPSLVEKKHWETSQDGLIIKKLVPDESFIKVVAIIKKHRRAGKSYAAITRWLNQNRIRSKNGKFWNHVTVKKYSK